jgi:hypothetical protein
MSRGDDVCSLLAEERRSGWVTCTVRELLPYEHECLPDALGVIVDGFVDELGFHPIGDLWNQIDREDAELVLTRLLNKGQAYDVAIMEESRARELATMFLSLFAANATFYTNGPVSRGKAPAGWHPITDATFDRGIVCVDSVRVGIAWMQDED